MTKRKASPIEQAGGTRASVYWLEVEKLHVEPNWNVREDYGDIEGLARSIASEGVKEPLTGYFDEKNRAIVTNGHRRMKAIELAKQKFGAEIRRVLFQLEPRSASQADRTLTMLVSNSGKPLTPYEIGKVVQRLRKFGWTLEEIQQRAGYSKIHLENCELLAGATAPIQQMVLVDKSVSQTTAMRAIRKHGVDRAAGVLEEALARAQEQGQKKASGSLVHSVGQQIVEGTELEESTPSTEAVAGAGETAGSPSVGGGQQEGPATQKRKRVKTPIEVTEADRQGALQRIQAADWSQVEGVDLLKVKRLLDRKQIPDKVRGARGDWQDPDGGSGSEVTRRESV